MATLQDWSQPSTAGFLTYDSVSQSTNEQVYHCECHGNQGVSWDNQGLKVMCKCKYSLAEHHISLESYLLSIYGNKYYTNDYRQ